MNNPFSSAKGENLTSQAKRDQSHPAVTSAPWRKELQLTLVTVEIAANAHYSQSPLIEALWRGSRSISAIQSNIPRKHWSLVWVWHLFLRSVQSPQKCMKSKHQEKAKSLQSKSSLDSSYPESTSLHNSAQIAVKGQLTGDREVWSSHSNSDCSCWITQQLWNSCATKNKHDECYHRVTASAGKALENIPVCCQHCHLFSLSLGMCLLHQSIHFGCTPQLLFFWHVLLSA